MTIAQQRERAVYQLAQRNTNETRFTGRKKNNE